MQSVTSTGRDSCPFWRTISHFIFVLKSSCVTNFSGVNEVDALLIARKIPSDRTLEPREVPLRFRAVVLGRAVGHSLGVARKGAMSAMSRSCYKCKM